MTEKEEREAIKIPNYHKKIAENKGLLEILEPTQIIEEELEELEDSDFEKNSD